MAEENDSNQSVEIMKKDMLLKLLKHMVELVENDDSLSGYIGYEAIEKKIIVANDDRKDFEVKCVFRSGNSEGEGFMTFIPDINHKPDTEENG